MAVNKQFMIRTWEENRERHNCFMLLLGKVCRTPLCLWEIPEFEDLFVFVLTRLVEYT